MEDNNYNILLKSGIKFFNIGDLVLLWSESNKKNISKLIYYYVKSKKIFKLKSGLYSIIPFDLLQSEHLFVIAQKLITPSYISYHSALTQHALNFQHYNSVHLSTLYNKTIILKLGIIGHIEFKFHKVKPEIFYANIGLQTINTNFGTYSIVSKERAIIESWYLNSQLGIDNKDSKLDLKQLIQIAKLYNQPRINKNLKQFFGITI